LLLARVGGEPKGVVALRALGPGICEMKRLYVDPAARGLKLGRRLAEAIMAAGRRLGSRVVRLDTTRRVPEANRLYERVGVRDTPPDIHKPLPDVRYREADL